MASCGAPRREGALHELRKLFFHRCQVLASVARAAMNAPTLQGGATDFVVCCWKGIAGCEGALRDYVGIQGPIKRPV